MAGNWDALRKIDPAIEVEVEYVELPDKFGYYVVAIQMCFLSANPTIANVFYLRGMMEAWGMA